jgi:hypothetical protein
MRELLPPLGCKGLPYADEEPSLRLEPEAIPIGEERGRRREVDELIRPLAIRKPYLRHEAEVIGWMLAAGGVEDCYPVEVRGPFRWEVGAGRVVLLSEIQSRALLVKLVEHTCEIGESFSEPAPLPVERSEDYSAEVLADGGCLRLELVERRRGAPGNWTGWRRLAFMTIIFRHS